MLSGGLRLARRTNRSEYLDYLENPSYAAYMQMDKSFAGSDVNMLMDVGDTLSTESAVEYLSTAGWAHAEAALAADNYPADFRHFLLDEANTSWLMAQHRQQEFNQEDELTGDHFSEQSMRLRLALAFIPLFHAMIDGDITKQVRAQLYEEILDIAALNASALQEIMSELGKEKAGPQIGLAHELNAILAVNRLMSPTLIAMPSTAKGGNGMYQPADTHDIDLLHLQWGDIMGITTLESKAKPRDRHYGRYNAAIVNGRVHLYVKNGKSPVDTVMLFLKEYDGVLSGPEYRNLEEMTDTIVHLARHQQQSSLGIPLQCRDIQHCNVVPKHRSVNPTRHMGHLAVAT